MAKYNLKKLIIHYLNIWVLENYLCKLYSKYHNVNQSISYFVANNLIERGIARYPIHNDEDLFAKYNYQVQSNLLLHFIDFDESKFNNCKSKKNKKLRSPFLNLALISYKILKDSNLVILFNNKYYHIIELKSLTLEDVCANYLTRILGLNCVMPTNNICKRYDYICSTGYNNVRNHLSLFNSTSKQMLDFIDMNKRYLIVTNNLWIVNMYSCYSNVDFISSIDLRGHKQLNIRNLNVYIYNNNSKLIIRRSNYNLFRPYPTL